MSEEKAKKLYFEREEQVSKLSPEDKKGYKFFSQESDDVVLELEDDSGSE